MYEPQPQDIMDAVGLKIVRARFIQHNTWLVYSNCGDTAGAVTQDADDRYTAHCNGRTKGRRKKLTDAIALLLHPEERKQFLGA